MMIIAVLYKVVKSLIVTLNSHSREMKMDMHVPVLQHSSVDGVDSIPRAAFHTQKVNERNSRTLRINVYVSSQLHKLAKYTQSLW